MSRARKPTAIKALQGTLQPCRTPKNEPKPQADISTIAAPSHLNESSRDIWNFAVEQMPKGVITTCDVAILARWASLYDQFAKLSQLLDEQGLLQVDEKGQTKVNPLHHAIIKTSAELRAIETQLGFTPASRSKVSAVTNDEEETNAFLTL